MINYKFTGVILTLCSSIPLMGQSASTANRLKDFKDVSTGVTYRYPEDWKQVSGNQFYLFPAFLPDQAAIRSGVLWAPNGILKNTNLTGAEFVFALQRGTSSRDCMHPVAQFASGSHVDSVTLNGIEYAHNSAETGGMCHQMKEDVYTTYQNNGCYIFDLSVQTICSGAVDGMRDATKKELADVDTRLIDILETVRIDQHLATTAH